MKALIRRWGNSQGVIIPKPILVQLGLEAEVEMTIENGAIVLSRPKPKVREGWADDSKMIAVMGDDKQELSEFGNEFDKEWAW